MTLPNPARHQAPRYTAAVVVVAALPWFGLNQFWMRQLILVALLALVVSGLNLTFGYAGELALGQAAVYATGAYTAGYLAKTYVNDVLLMLVASAAIAVLIGALTGAPGLRLGGWMLAIGSFFLVLLVPDIVNLVGEPLGGYEGLTGIPVAQVFGQELQLYQFYVLTVVVVALWFAGFRNLIRSPKGAEFRVLATGQTLASSLGVSTYSVKLKAYTVGAVPAGMAGCLFAHLDGYVAPSSFGLHAALMILAASVLGGMRTIYGAILGAALMVLGPMSSSAFDQYATVAFGLFLLLGGVFLPNGLSPHVATLAHRLTPARGAAPGTSVPAGGDLGPVQGGRLEVVGVVKNFGGLHALDDVTLTASPGTVTALIGPNGSGKTTLLNVISGYYTPDKGEIRIDAEDVSAKPATERAVLGVGRTFQTPTIPTQLTVREVIRTGALKKEAGLLSTILRLPTYRRRERQATKEVDVIMAALGISEHSEEPAAALPLGTRRLVELGRALALEPSVLLLDEVASGLDEDEVAELSAVVNRLREAGATVVLVEHNFDLITSVSDTVYVLAEGSLIASGTPRSVAQDPDVRQIYLGAGPVHRRRHLAGATAETG